MLNHLIRGGELLADNSKRKKKCSHGIQGVISDYTWWYIFAFYLGSLRPVVLELVHSEVSIFLLTLLFFSLFF